MVSLDISTGCGRLDDINVSVEDPGKWKNTTNLFYAVLFFGCVLRERLCSNLRYNCCPTNGRTD